MSEITDVNGKLSLSLADKKVLDFLMKSEPMAFINGKQIQDATDP
jgi:hypothetical protein